MIVNHPFFQTNGIAYSITKWNDSMAKLMLYCLTILFIQFSLFGCTKLPETKTPKQNVQTEHVSMTENQSPALQAQNKIYTVEGILSVKAVNTGNDLYVAAKPAHYKRFQLHVLRKEISNKLQESFPTYNYHVSLDGKIYKLVEQLQGEINRKEIDTETIAKRGKIIQSEMKSDT